MFDNISDKLRTFAAVLFLLGIIASVVLAIISFANAGDAHYNDEQTLFTIMGLVYLVVGPLSSWLSSLVLFALGDIYENTEEILKNARPTKTGSLFTDSVEKTTHSNNQDKIFNDSVKEKTFSGSSNYVKTICPHCQESITVAMDQMNDNVITCPWCNGLLKV